MDLLGKTNATPRRLTGSRAPSNASIHSLRARPSFMDRDKDKTPAFLTQLQEKLR